ncbi:MAG TPA: YraN family protein [Acidimicrobiia bacterium]
MPPDPRRALGTDGETLAASWYESAGYVVLDRNWRCRDGELDLVVAGPDVVVFCEVKTRRGDGFGVPAEAVTAAKQRRIRALGARWLRERGVRVRHVRFDVVAVLARRGSRPVIDVISDAF